MTAQAHSLSCSLQVSLMSLRYIQALLANDLEPMLDPPPTQPSEPVRRGWVAFQRSNWPLQENASILPVWVWPASESITSSLFPL